MFLLANGTDVEINGPTRSCVLNNDYSIDYERSRKTVITVIGGTATFDPASSPNGCDPQIAGVVRFLGQGTSQLTYTTQQLCNSETLDINVNWNSSGSRRLEVSVQQTANSTPITKTLTFLGRQVKVTEPDYGILCLPDGNNHNINVGSVGPVGATSKTWSYTVSDGSTASFSSPSSQYTTFNGLHSKAFWSINSTWTCPGESPSVGGVSFYAGDPTDQECSYYRASGKEEKEEASIDSFTEEETNELDLNEHLIQPIKNLDVDISTDIDDRISLFPNPVSVGQPITLKVNKSSLKKQGYTPIIISDINGRIIFNSRIQDVVTTLNLDSGIDKGYYIIQVIGDIEVKNIPFIIR